MKRLAGTAFVLIVFSLAACVRLIGPPAVNLPQKGNGPLSAEDSLKLVTQLGAAADHFVQLWRYYWELSEFMVEEGGNPILYTWEPPAGTFRILPSAKEMDSVRRAAPASRFVPSDKQSLIHCHPDGSMGSVSRYIIMSDAKPRAICPTWHHTAAVPWDERQNFDAALVPSLREKIRSARATLLNQFEQAGSVIPGDAWIAGQRVRFAFDQRDTAAVTRAINDCHATTWWCLALRGFALNQQQKTLAADSVFLSALAEMPSDERCRWTDLTVLFEDEDRAAYSSKSCAERERINKNLWWLSDPVYGDRGNDRRAEHFARHVLATIRSANDYHERWDMRPEGGGSAIREMIIRYGWPSVSYWDFRRTDIDHYKYVGKPSPKWYVHGRFTTAEYSEPRYRFVPSLRAGDSPSSAVDSDWIVSSAVLKYLFPRDSIWWPREHYDRVDGPIVQIWNQHGLFRRQDTVLFALATDLASQDFGGARDTLRGNFFFGSDEHSMRAAPARGVTGSVNVLKALVSSRPQVVSLELRGNRIPGVVARSRFGIEPPLPLSALGPGEIAISPPVFIQPTLPEELPPNDPESALLRMFPGVGFRDQQSLGLYWETYGFGERDSIAFSIQVESNEPRPGLLRRLGFAIGLGNRPSGTVAAVWSDAQPAQRMNIVSGTVPIQGRVITLNISQLQSGDYTMVVSASRVGQPPVTASRDFAILRR